MRVEAREDMTVVGHTSEPQVYNYNASVSRFPFPGHAQIWFRCGDAVAVPILCLPSGCDQP